MTHHRRRTLRWRLFRFGECGTPRPPIANFAARLNSTPTTRMPTIGMRRCWKRWAARTEALTEVERAQGLDPTSKSVLADKGIILYEMGRWQEALDLLRQMEKAEPEFISPPRYLERIYLDMGDYPNYLVELRKVAILSHDNAAVVVASAAQRGYAAGGAHAMFENLRKEQQKLYDHGKFSSLALAGTCVLEGNKQDALKYLKIAYDQHEDDVVGLAGNRLFDELHDQPEMQRILAGVKISHAPGAGK